MIDTGNPVGDLAVHTVLEEGRKLLGEVAGDDFAAIIGQLVSLGITKAIEESNTLRVSGDRLDVTDSR